ncbi:EAL domain-containing protein [Thalassotalea sp. PLHSN55]|uniref:EAL domain-containing protein n=1 Tax=Thalassotalea sp. PLHSN55 TaxID=3435888 RepID=UPI003F87C37B
MQNRSTKEVAILATTLIVAIVVSIFATIRFVNQEYAVATLDSAVVVLMVTTFAYVYYRKKVEEAGIILGFFSISAILILVYIRGPSALLWSYPAIFACFYLLSTRKAIFYSFFALFCLTALVFPELNSLEFSSFLATYCITCLFSYVFSKTIQISMHKLESNLRINHYRNSILELMMQSTPLSEVLNAITKCAEQEMPDVMCSILLYNPKTNQLTKGAAPSLPEFYNNAIEGVVAGENVGSCGTAAFLKKRIIVEDIATHRYWRDYKELAASAQLAACWSEPILNQKNEVLGTFAIYHDHVASPTQANITLIELFTSLASLAIEREQTNKLIWHQANFDHLTGLPNRNMMQEHLQFAIKNTKRTQKKLALVMLDLDHFKDVNDSLGHDIGDLLLVETAKRIQNNIRDNDVVARLGGDEFVLILSELEDFYGPERIVQKLQQELTKPFHLKEELVHTSASMGITIFPDDATDIETLLSNADQAMYGSKSLGRNKYHYFTDEMRESTLKRLQLIKDLRCAVDNNEFFLVYQSIIDINTKKITKAEALLRWNHPENGLISPLEFIPIAEETGLIIEISNWIFEQVCQQIKLWRSHYQQDLQISINTSPRQYHSGDGNIIHLLSRLAEHDLTSDAVVFEITENLLMESHHEIENSLEVVQQMGVELAIDDFGTGYSSFSYLREFNADYLKIDKSFVQKMSQGSQDLALCEAIIVMAKKLNIAVIAEGIETKEQLNLLTKIGCDYGQGYLLSKPIIAEEFEQLLAKQLDPH